MDDIILNNFIIDDSPKKRQAPTGDENGDRNRKQKGDLVITLNKQQPIKAIVARKRNVTHVPAKSGNGQHNPQSANTINNQTLKQQSSRNHLTTNAGNNKSNVSKKSTLQKKSLNNELSGDQIPSTTDEKRTKHKPTCSGKQNRMLDALQKDLPKIELPSVQPLVEKLFSEQTLESLDIHAHSKKNIADLLHYTRLTMVQSMAISPLLNGSDALIRAQTGSGKTLAYALPLVECLHNVRPKVSRGDGIQAVVIVPTRELAIQTYELLTKLLKPYTWIVSGYLCGGEKRKSEKARLRAGLNILVGTPGRFCDHIRNTKTLILGNVRWLILDEADRLLELGYEEDVKNIVHAIQTTRAGSEDDTTKRKALQTVLLSATLTATVKKLAGLTLHDPVFIETSESINPPADGTTEHDDQLLDLDQHVSMPSTVKQSYILIPPKLRLVALSGLIAHEQHNKLSKILVFMATQDLVDFHYDVMVEVLTVQRRDAAGENENGAEGETNDTQSDGAALLTGVKFFKLHGRMTQLERTAVFQDFRRTSAAVLLCTDVVARGIDIPLVDLVVQYHAPQILADYVHRVGRTARAGESGKAVLFVDPAEVEFIKYLVNKRISIQEKKIDGTFNYLGQLLNRGGMHRVRMNKDLAAIELQHRYERLIGNEQQLFDSAGKAFVSWVRYYSNFPKELRQIFATRSIHMGHYAKSLGLRDAPRQFMKDYTGPKEDDSTASSVPGTKRRGQLQMPVQRRAGGNGLSNHKMVPGKNRSITGKRVHHDGGASSTPDFARLANRSRVLNTSEFASGFGPANKKSKLR